MSELDHGRFFQLAAESASKSTCLRSRCGAVLVNGGLTNWAGGFNGPPLNLPEHRRCNLTAPCARKPKSDRTCCVHAEQRAILLALRMHNLANDLDSASLYFVRIDDVGRPQPSGYPHCTVCSRLALDVGIAEWLLWHEDGIRAYDAATYNHLSHSPLAGSPTPPEHIPVIGQWRPA